MIPRNVYAGPRLDRAAFIKALERVTLCDRCGSAEIAWSQRWEVDLNDSEGRPTHFEDLSGHAYCRECCGETSSVDADAYIEEHPDVLQDGSAWLDELQDELREIHRREYARLADTRFEAVGSMTLSEIVFAAARIIENHELGAFARALQASKSTEAWEALR